MKSVLIKSLFSITLFTGLCISPLHAENLTMFNGAIMRDGKMLAMKDGETTPMEKDMIMANGATVTMDGKVKAKGAKTIILKEGQLVQTGGTIRMTKPGMMRDHVMIKDGKAIFMKDGKALLIEDEMTMSNETVVTKSGSYTTKDGKNFQLKDGEKMTMDGKVTPLRTETAGK